MLDLKADAEAEEGNENILGFSDLVSVTGVVICLTDALGDVVMVIVAV